MKKKKRKRKGSKEKERGKRGEGGGYNPLLFSYQGRINAKRDAVTHYIFVNKTHLPKDMKKKRGGGRLLRGDFSSLPPLRPDTIHRCRGFSMFAAHSCASAKQALAAMQHQKRLRPSRFWMTSEPTPIECYDPLSILLATAERLGENIGREKGRKRKREM